MKPNEQFMKELENEIIQTRQSLKMLSQAKSMQWETKMNGRLEGLNIAMEMYQRHFKF